MFLHCRRGVNFLRMAEKGIFGCIIKVAFVFAIFILLPNAFDAKFVLVKTSSQSAVKPKFLAVDNGDGTKTLLKLENNSSISNNTKPPKGIIAQNGLGIRISRAKCLIFFRV